MRPLIETPGFDRAHTSRCLAFEGDTPARTIADLETLASELARREHFLWLDVAQPTPSDFALLEREFGINPVVIEDVASGHERPKIEFYGDYVLAVAHGASIDGDGELVTHEIAVIAGRNWAITLRAFPLYPLDDIERRLHGSVRVPKDPTGLLYIVLDTIVDGYFHVSERYDTRLLKLESNLFDTKAFSERTEREIFKFKRALIMFRSIAGPMREMLLRLTHSEVEPLRPGLSLYFRDVHDHVMRVLEQVDVTRDLVNGTFDIHLSSQAAKQGEISKQLTIIATVFLPLTYITGFFGQNFGFMVNGITSPEIFWYLGIGSQLLTLVVLFWFFRRRGWM